MQRAVAEAMQATCGAGGPAMSFRAAEPLLFTHGRLLRFSQLGTRGPEGAARRIAQVAVRALLAQASLLQRQGRQEEAEQVVAFAARYDDGAGKMLSRLRVK